MRPPNAGPTRDTGIPTPEPTHPARTHTYTPNSSYLRARAPLGALIAQPPISPYKREREREEDSMHRYPLDCTVEGRLMVEGQGTRVISDSVIREFRDCERL